MKTGATPTRSGYTFQGYKDDKGNAITLEQAVATEPVSIKLDNGVLTINLGNGAYKLNVKAALATNKSLTVKLEDGVLKLYDSKGNLIEEVKL